MAYRIYIKGTCSFWYLTKILSFIVKINAKKKTSCIHMHYPATVRPTVQKCLGAKIISELLFFPSTYDISQDFDTSHTGLGNQNYLLIQTLRNVTSLYTEVLVNKFSKFYSIKFIVIT